MSNMARRRFRRVRHYAGRVRHRVSHMTIPMAPLAGIFATPAIQKAIPNVMSGNIAGTVGNLGELAGIPYGGTFSFDVLMKNWTPIIAGAVVHKAANMLGVNRILSKSKIPLIRL